MNRDVRSLLTALVELNRDVAAMCIEVLEGSLSPADEMRFGDALARGGQALRRQGRKRQDELLAGDADARRATP